MCRSGPRPRCSALLDAGAVLVGKANLHEFAWGVTGQNPWYGTVRNPVAPGAHDRRLERRQRGGARRRPRASSGSARTPAARSGCPAACCERRRAEDELGPRPDRRRLPALPDARHRRADGAHGRGRRADVVGAAGTPVPEPRLDGLTVGLLRRPPVSRRGRAAAGERRRRGDWRRARATRRTRRRGERARARGRHWPVFFPEALRSHAATFPARADEYGDNCRTKLELAQRRRAGAGGDAYRALERWRRYEPEVDLYVAPCVAGDLPAGGLRRARGAAARSPASCAGST